MNFLSRKSPLGAILVGSQHVVEIKSPSFADKIEASRQSSNFDIKSYNNYKAYKAKTTPVGTLGEVHQHTLELVL